MTMRRLTLSLFLVGFAVRLLLVGATHQYRDLQRYELQRTAYSLATTGVFGNPYAIATGPTAHVSPGYPLMLAGIYRLLGTGIAGEIAKEALASAVSALVWACVPLVGLSMRLPSVVGLAAGLAGALLPLKLSVETKGDWEAPFSALALIAITLSWRSSAVRSGLVWGVSLLFVSALLPVFVCFCFFSRSWKFAAIQCAVVAALLSPWVIRNWIALGSPVATRTNFGLELRLSNNDLAGPVERENFERGVYAVYHPLQSMQEAERVRDLGEVAYNRLAAGEALQWIRAHPLRFFSLTARRVLFFWFQPVPGQTLKAVWLGVLALAGFAGLVWLARERLGAALPLGIFLFILPLPNYLVHVGLRHRYPLDWILTLLAAYALYRCYDSSPFGSVRRQRLRGAHL